MGIFATPRYQEIVVHDLRTPLNVIMLALRMIDDSGLPTPGDLAEDLDLIRANAAELERMLSVVVDYSRLPQQPSQLAIGRFDPRRLVRDVIENQAHRSGSERVSFDSTKGPGEVHLDETVAHTAIHRTLANTIAAAQGKPVRVRLDGAPDRLVIEFIADSPPRDSVRSQTLMPDQFERVIGSPAERRGLDLSIAARVSDLFGGTSRLEAKPGQGTIVTLDWPARLARPE